MSLPKETSYAMPCVYLIINGMGFIQRIRPQIPVLSDAENSKFITPGEQFVRDPALSLAMAKECQDLWLHMTRRCELNELSEALRELFLVCIEMSKVYPTGNALQEAEISEIFTRIKSKYSRFVQVAVSYLDQIDYVYDSNYFEYLTERSKLFAKKLTGTGSEFSLEEYDDSYKRIRSEIIVGSYLTSMYNPDVGRFLVFKILDSVPADFIRSYLYINDEIGRGEAGDDLQELYDAYRELIGEKRMGYTTRAYCQFVLRSKGHIEDNGGIHPDDLDLQMAFLMYEYLYQISHI